MGTQKFHDPSRHSYYVTDAAYRELVEDYSNWRG